MIPAMNGLHRTVSDHPIAVLDHEVFLVEHPASARISFGAWPRKMASKLWRRGMQGSTLSGEDP
jgi:hypothetical protein